MNLNDSESEEDVCISTPPEIETGASASTSFLPEKSKSQYERTYQLFQDWLQETHTNSLSEDVLLDYFQDLSKRMKPSSLWAIYSMLRMTINLKNNVDISKYPKLCAFLKCKSEGYRPKKSKILTPQQIKEFLSSAPDKEYLFTKVGLIFGIMGACRRQELMKIETSHIEDLKTALLVHIPDTKTKMERQFVIGGTFYNTCKKYMELRPPNLTSTRFFLNFQRGKFTKQPIGINKFGSMASVVAKFLKLPDPACYTGHYLRRSSAKILVDSGTNVTDFKQHGQWCSANIAEGCMDHFLSNQINTVQNNAENMDITIAGSSSLNSDKDEDKTRKTLNFNQVDEIYIKSENLNDEDIDEPSLPLCQEDEAATIPQRKKTCINDPKINDVYKILQELQDKRDDCGVYGEHVAIKLRKFNDHLRAEVQHQINNILYEAEMGTLDYYVSKEVVSLNELS